MLPRNQPPAYGHGSSHVQQQHGPHGVPRVPSQQSLPHARKDASKDAKVRGSEMSLDAGEKVRLCQSPTRPWPAELTR